MVAGTALLFCTSLGLLIPPIDVLSVFLAFSNTPQARFLFTLSCDVCPVS